MIESNKTDMFCKIKKSFKIETYYLISEETVFHDLIGHCTNTFSVKKVQKCKLFKLSDKVIFNGLTSVEQAEEFISQYKKHIEKVKESGIKEIKKIN